MTGLQVKHLTTVIFEDLNFDISNSGLYGFIGRNGVGKSTLFSLFNGEIPLQDANIEIGKVAYIPSLDIFDMHMTAKDYLGLLSAEEQKTFQNNLDKMGGADFLSKKIGKYSLGMKELFAFLYIISIESEVVILDELLDGLDERRRFAAYDLLKQNSQEKIILLTSHNLSEVFEHCERVYLLEKDSVVIVDDLTAAQAKIFL